ncbi:MAG TPA: tRNA(Ile)(2)-agmatinylcytidine synthase [Methanomassiliicoccales archaeon]|jgi:tRNA(Ile2)-agmatinylcytidine synthase
MYVAFDDTDSVESMCTTYLATEVIDAMRDHDLIGLPRLVRLNPAVPWKTRGNAALSMRFGHGKGPCQMVGMIREGPIYSYSDCARPADPDLIMDRCSRLLQKWSRVEEDASPGLVVSPRKPRSKLYWDAVRGIVQKSEVVEELDRIGATRFEMEGGRGVIGATAALSWRPRDRTYEVIAYRERSRWGTPREVSDESVKEMDRRFPSTFNNYDDRAGRRAISPHTPCPVLFGIRGDVLEDLPQAMGAIESERVDRWILFLSNQGTDDHVMQRWKDLLPARTYSIRGRIVSASRTIAGGHSLITMMPHGSKQELDLAAYEPSKSFREVVRGLRPGDAVRAVGELRGVPRTLNLEKLEVLELADALVKTANPICPKCNKSMQSMGRNGGYRCKVCGGKRPGSAAKTEKELRVLGLGWYEPPVSARRHLSKPLKRT